jgi:hypothetical protein
MGVLRRFRRRPRGVRAAVAAVAVVLVAGVSAACDPVGLGSASVAYTTDQTATRKLQNDNVHVQWLNCTAAYEDSSSATPSASASETTVASVDCQGRTDDGQDITVTGKVTRAVEGACVRGDLTAKVGGRQVFHVSGLGDCDATPTPVVTYRPSDGQPQPGVTVTVTKTIWCQGDPTCWPVQGK